MTESSIANIAYLIAQKRFVEASDALDKAAPDGPNLYLVYQLGVALVRAGHIMQQNARFC